MCKNAQSTKEELEMFLRKQRDQFYTLAEEAQDLEGVIDPGCCSSIGKFCFATSRENNRGTQQSSQLLSGPFGPKIGRYGDSHRIAFRL